MFTFAKSFLAVTLGASLAHAVCEIPRGNEGSGFAEKNKKACIQQAVFALPTPDLNKPENMQRIMNPPLRKLSIANTETIYCRYVYQDQNGASAKFRCLRTNEKNELLDKKGNIVATEAEADEMKVRYHYRGDLRNSENYTSTAASRILFALGIPAHTNIMTAQVVCMGCGPKPFGQKKPENMTTAFKDASIEMKFDGKRMYDPTESPWSWNTLKDMSSRGEFSDGQRIQIDVMALANHFLGYTSDKSFQNAIVCSEKDETNENICKTSVVMTHDIGAAFGRRKGGGLLGGLFGDSPRGDIAAYEKATVFKKGTCEFAYSGSSLPKSVSAAGKAAFLLRAGNLTAPVLNAIFVTSHMGNLGTDGSAKEVAAREARWVNATLKKLEEIRSAPCR
jgi:hypothetical protein